MVKIAVTTRGMKTRLVLPYIPVKTFVPDFRNSSTECRRIMICKLDREQPRAISARCGDNKGELQREKFDVREFGIFSKFRRDSP